MLSLFRLALVKIMLENPCTNPMRTSSKFYIHVHPRKSIFVNWHFEGISSPASDDTPLTSAAFLKKFCTKKLLFLLPPKIDFGSFFGIPIIYNPYAILYYYMYIITLSHLQINIYPYIFFCLWKNSKKRTEKHSGYSHIALPKPKNFFI
jgi:hypothetical protein